MTELLLPIPSTEDGRCVLIKMVSACKPKERPLKPQTGPMHLSILYALCPCVWLVDSLQTTYMHEFNALILP